MRRRERGDGTMPLMEHLKALRKVLLISAYAIAFGAMIGWFFADPVFAYLAEPVTELQEVEFITTTPTEPIMVKLKMSLVLGLVIALPVIMWQAWSFLLPALKQNERKYLYLVVPISVILFLAGAAFCFYVVMPLGLKYLLFAGSEAVQSIPFVTKSSYLSFLLTFLLTFGLVFEMPVVLLALIRTGVLTPKTLAKKRKYAFFIIIVLAALVSPTPDLLTWTLVAGPMYFLYEISIWLGYLIVRRRNKAAAA